MYCSCHIKPRPSPRCAQVPGGLFWVTTLQMCGSILGNRMILGLSCVGVGGGYQSLPSASGRREKRQRTRTGRRPDAGRTIESNRTDADRTLS
eukprot:gene24918-biopygen13490